MNPERLNRLLAYLEEDPNDAFTLYALALEYRHSDDEKAREYFEELLARHPDYLGTYYHAAALYAAYNQKDKAKKVYEDGLALASKIGDHKTHRELQNAYNDFLMEDLL